eukprot:TRINITY_DN2154_c0_g1_i2.p1 TRINITY_DN2154_c0_g1~~TRINITY_DN2154_c0_g1_i2.p1  ORF type:complete len:395 (-),score=76.70 TRINITY_DN2154_c0_g1_i2:128-1312(-)
MGGGDGAHGHSLTDKVLNLIFHGGHSAHDAAHAHAAEMAMGMQHVPAPHVPHWVKGLRKRLGKCCDLAAWAVPVPPAAAPENQTMFFCVPLRTGTFYSGLFVTIVSWFFLFFRALFFTWSRHWVGGYIAYSKIALSLAFVPGCLFGPLGAAGAFYMSPTWVSHYIRYLMLQFPVAALVYYLDMPIVWSCPLWKEDAGKAIKVYGWSEAIYNVAINDLCDEEQQRFMAGSILRLLFLAYLVSSAQRYFDMLETEPKWLLRMPKGLDAPSGAFRIKGDKDFQGPYGALEPQLPFAPAMMPPGMAPGMMPPGMMAPGMMPPGMMPPGSMPPGMMPPGSMPGMMMPPGSMPMMGAMPPPGASMPPAFPGAMPPGTMPLSMMPPGPGMAPMGSIPGMRA